MSVAESHQDSQIQTRPLSVTDERRVCMTQLFPIAAEILGLLRYECPPTEVEAVLVTIPQQERGQLTKTLARAFKISEGAEVRPAEQTDRFKSLISEIASIAQGGGKGSHIRKQATTIACLGLNDIAGDIRYKAAVSMQGWVEPHAMEHLERVWLDEDNTQHRLRLKNTPTHDGAAVLTTMKDIVSRFPDAPLTQQQRQIIGGQL